MNPLRYPPFLLFLFLTLLISSVSAPAMASDPVKMVIDQRPIYSDPPAQIQAGRTLVPVRIISEELGASVKWNEAERTAEITRGSRSAVLKIDSRIVSYQGGTSLHDLVDVAPTIINGRTFVPLRLVSNMLGSDIRWNESSRTVEISSVSGNPAPFSAIGIASPAAGQTIMGTTSLQSVLRKSLPANAAEIRYYLLDPDTRKGTVIARGSNFNQSYTWVPSMEQQGSKLLAVAAFDTGGNILFGDAVPVQVSIQPRLEVQGITDGQVFTSGAISLRNQSNFAPYYVKYEIRNLDTGKIFTSDEVDPYGTFNWTPLFEDNGRIEISITGFDLQQNPLPGGKINATIRLEKNLALGGVKSGAAINGPVTLSASRNFQVSETQYLKRDPKTGNETLIAQVGYAAHSWFPGPEEAGNWELYVRVKDTGNRSFTSAPVPVSISGTPRILIQGVGPKQVITGAVQLSGKSNVNLKEIQFQLLHPETRAATVIASGADSSQNYSWTPASGNSGSRIIRVVGTMENGNKIISEEIPVTIFLGQLYTAKPVVERSQFLPLASGLAQQSAKTTGMSAALQTAQAILETGWGQSLPVDKYKGTFSYNLFGIKGTGPAGSVISNTWEEYNGTTFRIDASFRAYNNINQSWDDHKNLLLRAQRYEPFRAVMHDSTQGAWALRRAGYATDSKYPLKLVNIIRTYNLHQLDETQF